ncbi:recombinase zinc beta ribbon domain-containing protein [uncultured Roseobacter sp.]|uniref:recombinase zinc beta ribbon domain-containing protein n=1 Tax=uncultured Roseobacter sp. TaxID=114847 RepID=UPI0026179544|nr:recombinase zinc beta ribbon domain-containing protein [uncultured Roseobacter sp.]
MFLGIVDGQSTINGNRQRGTGILNNELYVGRMVWNRLRHMKDPVSGKRVSKLNPEDEWITEDVPDLRIVTEELWTKVKDRQGALNKIRKPFWAKQRPRNLFSGLIKCGECGGGYSIVSQTHLGCSNARNKGTCTNRMGMHKEKLEEDVLGALNEHLMDAELCKLFCDEYTKQMNKLRREHDAALDHYKIEFDRVKKQLSQMVDAICDGAPVAPIKDKMHALEARRVELQELLEDVEVAPPLLHPSIAHRYHEQVGKLIETLNLPEHRAEAVEVVRSLIEKIVLTPDESENRLISGLHGNLAGILSLSAETKSRTQLTDSAIDTHKSTLGLEQKCKNAQEGVSQVKLVAGVGFEPTTFRL